MKVNNILFHNNNNSIRVLTCFKHVQLLLEKATSEEKDKDYFVKSKCEKKTNKEDNDTQSSQNLNENETTSINKKIRRTQQSSKATRKQKFVASLLLCHIVLQFFLPYSHFISKVPNLLTLILLHYITSLRYSYK